MSEILQQLFTSIITIAVVIGYMGSLAFKFRFNPKLGAIFIVFLSIVFVPNLLFALIAKDSSEQLIIISFTVALVVAGIMLYQFFKSK